MSEDKGNIKSIPVPQIKKCQSEENEIFSWKNSRMTDIIKHISSSRSIDNLEEKKKSVSPPPI
jgi:hypothetical protein